jgi:small-conductance mechanosensitive channel
MYQNRIMKNILIFFFAVAISVGLRGQNQDSANYSSGALRMLFLQLEQGRISDSVKRSFIVEKLQQVPKQDQAEQTQLRAELRRLDVQDSLRSSDFTQRLAMLKAGAKGYPVTLYSDTLFWIFNRIGASLPGDRAKNITSRIYKLYDADFFYPDSLLPMDGDHTYDVVYGETIVLSISEADALWNNQTMPGLAALYANTIKQAIVFQRQEHSLPLLLKRLALVLLVFIGIWLLIRLIYYLHRVLSHKLTLNKDKWLRTLSYKDYTFLSAEQELKGLFFILKITRWFFVVLLIYLILPLIFSIFPFTRGWAGGLISWLWAPFNNIFMAIWDYLPNLFSIIAIYLVMKYFVRIVKYLFSEIESEKLKISGFHADWAMPTYTIVRFLLYAFMFVLIFPYLPGSDSNIFQGVSVFIGVLFSLGSSSAIANMIAGLVITYMRPFQIGDRIKLGDMTGIVIEKTMLVTRLRTIKNEDITIPNSSVLSGNTINYSANARLEGLIVHTTVTIGYDVPWRNMHQALIDAALRTHQIRQEPLPFVLQTDLNDFHVSYQINAFISDATAQVLVISQLHQNIQDVCNERGIEILSPHYRSQRDGNASTIPAEYLDPGYKAPGFRVDLDSATRQNS